MQVYFIGIAADELDQPFPHGHDTGLGECEAKDVLGLCVGIEEDLADAAGQDLGLSRARTGDHHHRSFNRIHGLSLFLVQGAIGVFKFFQELLAGRHEMNFSDGGWLLNESNRILRMPLHSLKRVQFLPISLGKAWDFFSDPANLATITPSGMGFHILSEHRPDRMYAGQIIEYRVSPILGIPLHWVTEITHVVEGRYFIDEQRFGPYSLWHHQHHFREVECEIGRAHV